MNTSTCYRSTLDKAASHALAYLDGLDRGPVGAEVSLKTLRDRLDRALEAQGTPAAQVIDELVAGVEGGLIGSAGGRFFAWVVGGTLPAALGADWLVSAWDQNASIYAASPAEAVIEETVGRWLKEVLRLPATASFALTTGCQMAHVTCLAAARHAVLSRLGWDVESQGLAGGPPIRLLSSRRHASVDRALRYLGLGTNSVTQLELDDEGSVRRASAQGGPFRVQNQNSTTTTPRAPRKHASPGFRLRPHGRLVVQGGGAGIAFEAIPTPPPCITLPCSVSPRSAGQATTSGSVPA